MKKTPIKVLQTIRQGKVGGGETHMYSLVSRIDRTKYEPVVLSFTDGPMVELIRGLGIKTYVIPTTRPFDPMVIKRVNEIIEEEDIEMIHAHGSRAASNSYRAAKKAQIPMVYTVHGWSFHTDQKPLIFNIRKQSEKLLCKNAHLTICVSHTNETEGQQLFDMQRSTVIENGVDFEKFNCTINDKAAIQAELGIPDEKVLVGYFVRMTKQKDPITLIGAIALAVKKEPNLHFLIVGEGDLKPEAYWKARELGVLKHITFTGFRSDIPRLLSAIDIYTLPSLWEGLPIGIIEAMAMKKAVICSDILANQELITHGQNGIIVPVKAPKELAQAFIELARNKEKRNALGEQAYTDALAKFDLDHMVQRITEQYDLIPTLQA